MIVRNYGDALGVLLVVVPVALAMSCAAAESEAPPAPVVVEDQVPHELDPPRRVHVNGASWCVDYFEELEDGRVRFRMQETGDTIEARGWWTLFALTCGG